VLLVASGCFWSFFETVFDISVMREDEGGVGVEEGVEGVDDKNPFLTAVSPFLLAFLFCFFGLPFVAADTSLPGVVDVDDLGLLRDLSSWLATFESDEEAFRCC